MLPSLRARLKTEFFEGSEKIFHRFPCKTKMENKLQGTISVLSDDAYLDSFPLSQLRCRTMPTFFVAPGTGIEQVRY